MALVVFLKGVNVGGHRTFRPTRLAEQLQHLGAVNIGAAGTFVVREPIARAPLREEVARRLPFAADIMICEGRDVLRLVRREFFAGHAVRADTTRFVSILSRTPRSAPRLPMTFPSSGRWLLKILARDGRFVVGLYRRHMEVVRYLGTMDRTFGMPVTTRNWRTIAAVARVLDRGVAG